MRFIKLDANNKVISIRYGFSIVEGEIQSDLGEIGQIKQLDGSFITPEPVTQPKLLTLEDLSQNQLTVMDAIASLYESLASKGVI